MTNFLNQDSTIDIYWRSIILFGRNVASYKFALAQSLLELSSQGKSQVRLGELAVPFSKNLINHLKAGKKQGTFQNSRFLNYCNDTIDGKISQDEMINRTIELGFTNVIDAFHVVNQGDIPIRFFIDERKQNNSIRLTDNLFALRETFQAVNLPSETEARWNLVETAWSLKISPSLLVVKFDPAAQDLYVTERKIRQSVTSCRNALNGYQKGKCFYCFRDISINDMDETGADVDHFFPNTLKQVLPTDKINLDGVWNLVLSCKECNRGEKGKFTRIPDYKYLERLNKRNNYLIDSHHPLRETLINQTGNTEGIRLEFLKAVDATGIQYLIHRWRPRNELPGSF